MRAIDLILLLNCLLLPIEAVPVNSKDLEIRYWGIPDTGPNDPGNPHAPEPQTQPTGITAQTQPRQPASPSSVPTVASQPDSSTAL